jgi:hypothetical protein
MEMMMNTGNLFQPTVLKNSAAHKNSVQTDSDFWAEFGPNRSDLTRLDPADFADFLHNRLVSDGFFTLFQPRLVSFTPCYLPGVTYGQHFASLLSSWMQ